ncbi:hypothetical protein AGABI2DRAFT_187019 [Agaricus bisporus var. bisporus H97]|uniref:hypothetical protein n=1 Tax=Agaricus bisporus var. bisporus (strain H97 / ATCC MYA-4626 / FGSC 10389) TaxID=936046 RepID=UPI00029F72C3|nr:hypothetical protein AGABI2DRAFT_187019 [Agaricus bisporus var. bisporus H97]EKV45282.1 hypothetical protein AGABI2DRAFT_187019 [Agaricus bisporus var. bisporus H97]
MSNVAMLPDFTEGLQNGRRQNPSHNRRETILGLVEMLLANEESSKPSLRNFANAARQLGSSVAILSSAFHLRERVTQVLFLYRENAAALFPRRVARAPKECVIDPQSNSRRRGRRWRTKTPPHIVHLSVNEDIDVEDFPDQIDYFARDIGKFLHCLNEFPEFTDEAVNSSILSFERDLQSFTVFRSPIFPIYAGQFRNPAVQRYLHGLSIEMGEHIDSITSTLSIFIEIGVPIIRFAQKHGATNLLNLSTVATFFSAVTATTMQFSYELNDSKLADAVNCFWFSSLVFSIAAAVNSLLGLTWKQAMYRSPGDRVPWWVLIWIKRSPLVFLVMSVACFSIGLCFFAYASHQAHVTSTVTTVLTALTSFGLCAVSAWFATERWIFMRYRGKKWLDDVLMEVTDNMLQNRAIDLSRQGLDKVGSGLVIVTSAIARCFAASQLRLNKNQPNDNESVLPVSNDQNSNHRSPPISQAYLNNSKEGGSVRSIANTSHGGRKSSETVLALQTNLGYFSGPLSPSITYQEKSPIDETQATGSTPFPSTAGKQRWQDAIRAVRIRAAIAADQGPSSPVVDDRSREPSRRRTTSSGQTDKRKSQSQTKGMVAKSRLMELVPRLKELDPTHDLAAHTALIKHMQFSPDGKFLATSSWDRTSVIFKVGECFASHRVLALVKGFVDQVAWSYDSQYLLTKSTKGVKVWITEQLDSFDLGRININDVAVTPDDKRIIVIGPLLLSPTGLCPSKSRVEKRLIVFNMETKQIECQVPVLDDVQDVTLAETLKNELVALFSCGNKAPPQLWKLEIVRNGETGKEHSRLTLRHTYMPKTAVDFAGPSYFGGRNKELVLCAGKDIFIWDTESGVLLHHILAQAHSGDLTCIAWNHAVSDPFMFASGSHDGTVRIWTKPPITPISYGWRESSNQPNKRQEH